MYRLVTELKAAYSIKTSSISYAFSIRTFVGSRLSGDSPRIFKILSVNVTGNLVSYMFFSVCLTLKWYETITTTKMSHFKKITRQI